VGVSVKRSASATAYGSRHGQLALAAARANACCLCHGSAEQEAAAVLRVARAPAFVALSGLLALPFMVATAQGQQLTPRAFWPTPVGTDVLVIGYQRSTGDIVVDQSLPLTGVDSTIDGLQLSYQHTFDWSGRTGTVQVAQSFADGTTSGFLDGDPRSRRTVGAGDVVGRVAVNLIGAPAMSATEFRDRMRDPNTLLGVSLSVSLPTGEYDADRLINLGTNRITVRPALGVIHPLQPGLYLEGELGVWWFEDNDEFLGQTREQAPVFDAQVHLVKRFKPGFWGSLDANYYVGGRTRIDGERNRDLQRNSRFGATLVYPLTVSDALRVSTSFGTVTETGGDFDLFSLAWVRVF
jgi:hypothetical protein